MPRLLAAAALLFLLGPPPEAPAAGKTQPMMIVPPRGGTLKISPRKPGRVRAVCLNKEKKAPTDATSFGKLTPGTGRGLPVLKGVKGGRRHDIGPLGSEQANQHVTLQGVTDSERTAEMEAQRDRLRDQLREEGKELPEEIAELGPVGDHRQLELRVVDGATGYDSYELEFRQNEPFIAEPEDGDLAASGMNRPDVLRAVADRLRRAQEYREGSLVSREDQNWLWQMGKLNRRETRVIRDAEDLGLVLRSDESATSVRLVDGELVIPPLHFEAPRRLGRLQRVERVVASMRKALEAVPDGVDQRQFYDHHLDAWRMLGPLTGWSVRQAAEVVRGRRVDGKVLAADGGVLPPGEDVVVVDVSGMEPRNVDGLIDAVAGAGDRSRRICYALEGEASVPRLAAAHGGGRVEVVGDDSLRDNIGGVRNMPVNRVIRDVGGKVGDGTGANVRVWAAHQAGAERAAEDEAVKALEEQAENGDCRGSKSILAMCNLKNGEHVRLARVLIDNGAEAVVIPRDLTQPEATVFATAEISDTPWRDGTWPSVLSYWQFLHEKAARRVEYGLRQEAPASALKGAFPAAPAELFEPGGRYIDEAGRPTQELRDLPDMLREDAELWELFGAREGDRGCLWS